jgi:hypothetical protein
MKENRSITLKSHVTVDDFLAIVANAKAVRKSVSTHIRDCCLPRGNVKPEGRPGARPSLVPFQAKFAPARSVRPAAYMRS